MRIKIVTTDCIALLILLCQKVLTSCGDACTYLSPLPIRATRAMRCTGLNGRGGVQQIYFEAIVPAVTLQSRLWVLEWPSVHVESQVLISFFFVSRQIGRIVVSPGARLGTDLCTMRFSCASSLYNDLVCSCSQKSIWRGPDEMHL